MPEENVELLRRGYEAWNRGDTKTLEALWRDRLDPGFELDPLYIGQVYKGVEGMRDMWADLGEIWEDFRFEVEDISDLGQHVLVVGRISGRGAGSGVPITQRIVMLWTFEDAKAVYARSYASREEALAGAGLLE
jgi:ketosteroid isomerase-like protein